MSQLFVFEGVDGAGKSTIVAGVEAQLRKAGVRCLRLSSPGDTPGTLGRHVYDLHHDPATFGITSLAPSSLQLLHVASHVDAIERLILPALSSGMTVLLDRFWWSTWAYGTTASVPAELLDAMLQVERLAWSGVTPTAIFLVRRPTSIHSDERVRLEDAYRSLEVQSSPSSMVVALDNSGPIDRTITAALAVILPGRPPTQSVSQLTLPALGVDEGHSRPSRQRDNRPAARSLHVLSRLEPAKPSIVYDTYWRFAEERQAIFFRRLRRESGPLTSDPILLQHKFTNAYRASDRVSQFLIRRVIYAGPSTAEELFFRTILFKMFNRIDTWRMLEEAVESVTYADYTFKRYDKVLTRAMAAGQRIYSAAYIMPAARAFGADERKHRTHLRLLEKMMADEVPRRMAEMRSMRDAFQLLRSYPMLGDFLAYQFVTDLNYSELTNFAETEFVVPGPGARDGLRKCFISTGGLSEADLIRVVADRQDLEFERLGIAFQSLWGRRLQLIDCQNLFCEVDKYARVAHPDISGVSGRTRIKQVYRRTADPIVYWYPPKWGINDAVQREQGATELAQQRE